MDSLPLKSGLQLITSNYQELIHKLTIKNPFPKELLEQILNQSEALLSSIFVILEFQPNLIPLTSQIVIIGDIHGQFDDLLSILSRYPPSKNKLLFLGDYVDRGMYSIECLTLLAELKIQFPKSVFLLRGNHEGRQMTNRHNFRSECEKKYGIQTYHRILQWFKSLPLAALVDGKYFCVHAGISPCLQNAREINSIHRQKQIPERGLMCDLLWSDPTAKKPVFDQWLKNKNRSISYFFTDENSKSFLKDNNFKMIIRAHEVSKNGYKYQKHSQTNQKLTLTIFSAPNYCGKLSNKGSIALIRNGEVIVDTFTQMQTVQRSIQNINDSHKNTHQNLKDEDGSQITPVDEDCVILQPQNSNFSPSNCDHTPNSASLMDKVENHRSQDETIALAKQVTNSKLKHETQIDSRQNGHVQSEQDLSISKELCFGPRIVFRKSLISTLCSQQFLKNKILVQQQQQDKIMMNMPIQ